MRPAVVALRKLGAFPSQHTSTLEQVREHERLYREIEPPVTNEEARVLVGLFGPDDYFGIAEALVNLIETAPEWPIQDCLRDTSNIWVTELKERAIRGGLL